MLVNLAKELIFIHKLLFVQNLKIILGILLHTNDTNRFLCSVIYGINLFRPLSYD